MKDQKIRYYTSFADDFVETRDQNHRVPADYPWAPNRFLSGLVYAAAVLFSGVYLRLFLHVRYKNRRALKAGRENGAFIYCNHTQPFGDVFLPALPCLPGRIYTVVSPANLAIPVIGKILPYLGALPIPDTMQGMRRFTAAMEGRLNERRYIAIFPEAHVWEYYTGIRPYGERAFKYPVKFDRPVYAMTVTYQRRRWGRKPRATVYIDGPFSTDTDLSPKARTEQLRDRVYDCMKDRSRNSNYDYIRYEPRREG